MKTSPGKKTPVKKLRTKVGPDDLLGTEAAVAEACGVGRWTVTAVKAATRGKPDNPWSGRFTTKRRFNDWLLSHPDFRAYKVMRKPKPTDGTVADTKVA